MSNNSYLFAVGPTADGQLRHVLVAQARYESPLLFLLMCSVAPTQVATRIFANDDAEEPIAILADFAGGRDCAEGFMDSCLTLNKQHPVVPHRELERMVAGVRSTLQRAELAHATHFLLEAGEIIFMICANKMQAARRLLMEVRQSPTQAKERLRTIFLEPYCPPTDQADDDGFYIPDFDRMTDAEYFEFVREDFEDADALRPPPEKLEKLGFGAFGATGYVNDFYTGG